MAAPVFALSPCGRGWLASNARQPGEGNFTAPLRYRPPEDDRGNIPLAGPRHGPEDGGRPTTAPEGIMVRSVTLVLLALAGVTGAATADEPDLRKDAAAGLRRAVEYYRTHVATEGGYLWRYSDDL